MSVSLATFNVKNLLEPRDERERAVLPGKLDWIARMIRACDADVVGLQEIGPPELLDAVVARLERRGGYGEPILGTADARGIRCALLSRVPVLDAKVHTADALPFPVFREGDPAPFGERIPLRRGVVHARVEAPGTGTVDVLVVHFKSSRPVAARDAAGVELAAETARARAEGAVRSLVSRAAEALYVRGLVDGVLARTASATPAPGAFVAVVGDLNDVPDSVVGRILRADSDGVRARGDRLLDCAARIEARARYSALHEGRASQIDHVLASEALYARLESAAFLNSELRQHPPPDMAGDEVVSVDSDHAPLVARFG
jgi:endonuclease/exonuclease/phosphatase family metal-dependent hydrolase